MTASQSRWLAQETDIEFLENKIEDARDQIGALLSIEEIFTQDCRGVREAFSHRQIAENRTQAAELSKEIEQYEERISVLRAEEELAARAV